MWSAWKLARPLKSFQSATLPSTQAPRSSLWPDQAPSHTSLLLPEASPVPRGLALPEPPAQVHPHGWGWVLVSLAIVASGTSGVRLL